MTSLVNTKWIWNNTISITEALGSFTVSFDCCGITYNVLSFSYITATGAASISYSAGGTTVTAWTSADGWTKQQYRGISFSSDPTTLVDTLIAIMEARAVVQTQDYYTDAVSIFGVAAAIRDKAETSDELVYPGGFIETINSITGYHPTGKLEITTTDEVDVFDYATAQVVDENLITDNIRGGISILGITGSPMVMNTELEEDYADEKSIRLGFSAFVNGEQVDGIIPTYAGAFRD